MAKLCPFKKEIKSYGNSWNSHGIITNSNTREDFSECVTERCMAFDSTFKKCKLIDK